MLRPAWLDGTIEDAAKAAALRASASRLVGGLVVDRELPEWVEAQVKTADGPFDWNNPGQSVMNLARDAGKSFRSGVTDLGGTDAGSRALTGGLIGLGGGALLGGGGALLSGRRKRILPGALIGGLLGGGLGAGAGALTSTAGGGDSASNFDKIPEANKAIGRASGTEPPSGGDIMNAATNTPVVPPIATPFDDKTYLGGAGRGALAGAPLGAAAGAGAGYLRPIPPHVTLTPQMHEKVPTEPPIPKGMNRSQYPQGAVGDKDFEDAWALAEKRLGQHRATATVTNAQAEAAKANAIAEQTARGLHKTNLRRWGVYGGAAGMSLGALGGAARVPFRAAQEAATSPEAVANAKQQSVEAVAANTHDPAAKSYLLGLLKGTPTAAPAGLPVLHQQYAAAIQAGDLAGMQRLSKEIQSATAAGGGR